MKSKKYASLLLIVMLSLFFFNGGIRKAWYNLFPKGAKYGVNFNEDRLQLGVLPLPEEWSTNDNADEFKTWRPNKVEGYRTMKTVILENDKIVAEVDYLKNNVYTLQIKYSYTESQPWEIKLQDGQTDFSLSKPQLDSILTVWGVR